jgi:uncharacterized membrane protein
MKTLFIPLFLMIIISLFFGRAQAQENRIQITNYEARITEISQQDNDVLVKVLITSGELKGTEALINLGYINEDQNLFYKTGDRVLVTQGAGIEGEDSFYITDIVRKTPLYWLFGLFLVTVTIVTGFSGLRSVMGLVFSFFIIFKFILPNILNGYSPLLIAILGAVMIAPITFYLSHGLNRKTSAALISTFIALIITGVLAGLFINAARITGFASEDAFFLNLASGESINIRGLLLAGIIIGTLGILDDVTVSQASIVSQLKKANRRLGPAKLYSMAMRVGHDHIASAVNTLVLVYTGAALPLLLLFVITQLDFGSVINYELVAEEIIRTLVGSIGLILAVPISTLIAVYMVNDSDKDPYNADVQ